MMHYRHRSAGAWRQGNLHERSEIRWRPMSCAPNKVRTLQILNTTHSLYTSSLSDSITASLHFSCFIIDFYLNHWKTYYRGYFTKNPLTLSGISIAFFTYRSKWRPKDLFTYLITCQLDSLHQLASQNNGTLPKSCFQSNGNIVVQVWNINYLNYLNINTTLIEF